MPFDVGPLDRTQRERRLSRRLAAKDGAKAELRVGALGMGRDVAFGLVDVSQDGLCVRVKTRLDPGSEVEVKLTGPGLGKALAFVATVCWCRPIDGFHLAGLKLNRRLTYREINDLVKQW
jgi:hypothetical protein